MSGDTCIYKCHPFPCFDFKNVCYVNMIDVNFVPSFVAKYFWLMFGQAYYCMVSVYTICKLWYQCYQRILEKLAFVIIICKFVVIICNIVQFQFCVLTIGDHRLQTLCPLSFGKYFWHAFICFDIMTNVGLQFKFIRSILMWQWNYP